MIASAYALLGVLLLALIAFQLLRPRLVAQLRTHAAGAPAAIALLLLPIVLAHGLLSAIPTLSVGLDWQLYSPWGLSLLLALLLSGWLVAHRLSAAPLRTSTRTSATA